MRQAENHFNLAKPYINFPCINYPQCPFIPWQLRLWVPQKYHSFIFS